MSKAEKNRSIKDILAKIESNAAAIDKDLNSELSNSERSQISKALLFESAELRKWAKEFKRSLLFFVILFFITLIGIFLFGYYTDTLQDRIFDLNSEIELKVDKIDNYKWSDSMLTKFMGMKYDSTTHTKTFNHMTENGKDLSYNDILRERDSLRSTKYSIQNFLNDSIARLNNELNEANIKLLLAQQAYNISFSKSSKKNSKGESYYSYSISSKQIDSALLFFNGFRKNIIYDSTSKKWYLKNK